jgi:putative NIF3 family GTP cyclohydrolase 1 type 2
MTIQQIFDLAIEMGTKADPRGADFVKKVLEKRKKAYEELSEKKKKYFDKTSLINPYMDSGIIYGDTKKQVKKILSGIDTDASELLLVDRLNERGAKIDLVIGHHPIGATLAALHEVMDLQTDVYAGVGVPVNLMDALMSDRMQNIKRRIHPHNLWQVQTTAELLDIPLMNIHTIWDNMGDKYMKDYLAKKTFDTVGEINDYLMELPEYQAAAKMKNEPVIVSGSPSSRAGKVALFFTGGTNPSKEAYVELAKAGVGTLVDMHIPEDGLTELKKLHVNVINAGHMASDSIGANLFFDALDKQNIEVVATSGLIRVNRNKK